MSTIHYFDRDGTLNSYTEERDEDGKVTFTAGTKPPGGTPEASKAEIAAYFRRLVDARREQHEADQRNAAAIVAAKQAEVAGHRAALEAAGIPTDTVDALMPQPPDFTPASFILPPVAASAYERYGLSQQEAQEILRDRSV